MKIAACFETPPETTTQTREAEHRTGGDRAVQQAEKHAAARGSYESQKEGEPAGKEIWIRAEKVEKSASDEETEREIRRKHL